MKHNPFNKVIIYDSNCPLCQAYTKAFANTGLLQKQNRLSFSEITREQFPVNWQRARHEIPLVDPENGQVLYGVDALVAVLQQKFTFLPHLLKLKWLNWLSRKLYNMVSYNKESYCRCNKQQY